jgi:membrane-associated phospholipid phosphatase
VLSTAGVLALALALQAPATPPPSSPPPLPDDRPIQDIFQNLGHDLAQLPSLDTLTIVGAGAVAAIAAHPADDNLATWAADRGPSGYTRPGAVLGDGWLQGGAAIGTYVVGLAARDRRTVHVGSDLIRGQVLNAVITRGAKLVADRRRPGGGSDSMPSGHTTASFATAAVLQEHFGWQVGLPSFATAGLIGWTRVRDHAHWLTDVIVGAAVGVAVGHTVAGGHRHRTWVVVPAAGSQSVALYVVRVK